MSKELKLTRRQIQILRKGIREINDLSTLHRFLKELYKLWEIRKTPSINATKYIKNVIVKFNKQRKDTLPQNQEYLYNYRHYIQDFLKEPIATYVVNIDLLIEKTIKVIKYFSQMSILTKTYDMQLIKYLERKLNDVRAIKENNKTKQATTNEDRKN